jgi:hypothetical protein
MSAGSVVCVYFINTSSKGGPCRVCYSLVALVITNGALSLEGYKRVIEGYIEGYSTS